MIYRPHVREKHSSHRIVIIEKSSFPYPTSRKRTFLFSTNWMQAFALSYTQFMRIAKYNCTRHHTEHTCEQFSMKFRFVSQHCDLHVGFKIGTVEMMYFLYWSSIQGLTLWFWWHVRNWNCHDFFAISDFVGHWQGRRCTNKLWKQ